MDLRARFFEHRSVAHERSAGLAFLAAFGLVALGVGAARAITTTYVPVLLDRIEHAPGLIGAVMLVNAAAGFVVPLAVGVWTDRRAGGRFGRRVPWLVAGAALTSGGLVAVALGTGSSYLVLGLAAAVVYVGLNTAATAHRAIVVESFEDGARPAATSSQETALLVGGLVGVLAGGFLVEPAPWLPFALIALLLPALAIFTAVASLRRLGAAPAGALRERQRPARAASARRRLVAALRRPGPRDVLIAQILWVAAYAALPVYFILYADRVLALGPGLASVMLAGFGLLGGAAMLVAGRTPPERVYSRLVLGAALLGGGLAAASLAESVVLVSLPFAVAAVGAGLVTALGFPYFARFIPAGGAGGFSGLFFSVRAVATAGALPIAGFAIAATGSYRSLLLLGGAALLAIIPLAAAERRRLAASAPRPAVARLAAVIPCHDSACLERVVAGTLAHVDELVIVADGCPPRLHAELERISQRAWAAHVVWIEHNSGKGDAVAAGIDAVLRSDERPDAIIVLDADGQHPWELIPQFAAAARDAELVIGDRLGDTGPMPLSRRFTNRVSSALLTLVCRQRMRDSQCGMRLYRTELLERVPPPPGRYEAETVHLRALVRAGARVAWVQMPTIYDGAASFFRPVRDTARVLAAIVLPGALVRRAATARRRRRTPAEHDALTWPSRTFWRFWGVRLAALVVGTWAIGGLIPLIQPVDQELFVAINSLGAGPDWIYRALDPHSRNYFLLCLVAVLFAVRIGPRHAVGVLLAVTAAAFFSDILVQTAYLLYDRPRPEEVLGAQALLTNGRHWSHIASFPSGHLVVTTAIGVAAMSAVPALRAPIWMYIAAIAVTRITFGAHFPLDVAVGLLFGYEVGRFAAALARCSGLLQHELTAPLPRKLPGWLRPRAAAGRSKIDL